MRGANGVGRTDTELLAAARAGDNDAISALYRQHHGAALRLARSLRGCDAEDTVAEAFTGLLRQLRRGHGPERDFRSYLLQAVRNTYVSDIRKRSRYVTSGDDSLFDGASAGTDESSELCDAVGDEFARLTDRERQALWLSAVEGYSLAEIGRHLGTTQGSAGALAYRARKHLRHALANRGRLSGGSDQRSLQGAAA